LTKILTHPSKKNSIKYLTNKALLMPMLDKNVELVKLAEEEKHEIMARL
jgi:hypothetical protein